eukprot:gene15340-biopygen9673
MGAEAPAASPRGPRDSGPIPKEEELVEINQHPCIPVCLRGNGRHPFRRDQHWQAYQSDPHRISDSVPQRARGCGAPTPSRRLRALLPGLGPAMKSGACSAAEARRRDAWMTEGTVTPCLGITVESLVGKPSSAPAHGHQW